jgi:hypothetical protein
MPKTKFPTKTEIAAWWIITYGIVTTIAQISFLSISPAWSDYAEWSQRAFIYILILLVIGLLYILPIRFLFRRERWPWTVAVVIMSINILILIVNAWIISAIYLDFDHNTVLLFIPLWILGVVPLVLVVLDRKNYFEILRQRKLEKKEK